MKPKMSKCFLLLFAFTVLFSSQAGAKAQYTTIGDLQTEASVKWNNTLNMMVGKKQEQMPIKLPMVDKFPAIKVKPPPSLEKFIPGNAETFNVEKSGIRFSVRNADNVYSVDKGYKNISGTYDVYYEEDAQAENSPLTAKQAWDFVWDQFVPLMEATGADVRLKYQEATSRHYKNIAEGGRRSQFPVPDYSFPMTQMGFYSLNYTQHFHGIPYLSDLPFRYPSPGSSGRMEGIEHLLYALIGTEQDYCISFYVLAEDRVLADDVPLASFEDIRQELERLVREGYVHALHRMELGYMGMYNPEDGGKTFILVPVWEVRGEFSETPGSSEPDDALYEYPMARERGGMMLYINAQTAAFMNPADKSPDRALADVVLWEQAK